MGANNGFFFGLVPGMIKKTIDKGADAAKFASNTAANDAKIANDAAIQKVKDAQGNASSQAQAILTARRRSGSQSIYTSPLGVTEQASTAKKTLLGE